jgi:hypothetical protein
MKKNKENYGIFLNFFKFLRERSLPRRIRGVLRSLKDFSSEVYLVTGMSPPEPK